MSSSFNTSQNAVSVGVYSQTAGRTASGQPVALWSFFHRKWGPRLPPCGTYPQPQLPDTPATAAQLILYRYTSMLWHRHANTAPDTLCLNWGTTTSTGFNRPTASFWQDFCLQIRSNFWNTCWYQLKTADPVWHINNNLINESVEIASPSFTFKKIPFLFSSFIFDISKLKQLLTDTKY